MKESNLAKAIDQAAEQRAKAILRKIRDAINTAVQPHWHSKEAGGEFIGDDIRKLLQELSKKDADWRHGSLYPSEHMLAACRAAIINDLLSGMPKLRELAMMAELSTEVCPQCGTCPCHCESAELN